MALVFISFQDDKTRQDYEEKRLAAPQNAKGQYELGRWCDQHKLKDEAIKAYERAIDIDPDYEPARKALGHKKVLGRWTCEKNYADPSWWAHPRVDQKKVDEAIVKGCEYLLDQIGKWPVPKHPSGEATRYDELVLLTVLEAGWDRKDPRLQQLVRIVLAHPLDQTYNVSLRAMGLATLDPMRYQQELARCAQFLVDNQCDNGQWSYGKIVPDMPGSFPTTDKGPIPNISTGLEGSEKPGKPPKQIEIKKRKGIGPKTGDNSNSQYAALGLRACLTGLVVVPKETIQEAETWWEKHQKNDGGWSYGNPALADQSWGSMTAGAIGALTIYKYYRSRVWGEKTDWKSAPSIAKGVEWMAKHLDHAKNPSFPMGAGIWQHYWIYAIERAGRLLETEKFGAREWYPEPANWLLGRQQTNGNWPRENWANEKAAQDRWIPGAISETCFAILFLRRATPKLDETIPSGRALK
jgi:LPXTG-motif cell wall-anchored protein